MAYTKKTWEDFPNTSTPITADDLNNIEDGIEALDTGKVNISDIVNNLTSTSTTAPGSAKNDKDLKDMIDLKQPARTVWTGDVASNPGWAKILTIIPNAGSQVYKIDGISGVSGISGRGHFQILLSVSNSTQNSESCYLVSKNGGLTTASFDLRKTSTSPYTYELWFNVPQYTIYYFKILQEYGALQAPTLECTRGTPAGTALTIT